MALKNGTVMTRTNKITLPGLFIIYVIAELALGGGGDVFSFSLMGTRLTLRIVNFFIYCLLILLKLPRFYQKNVNVSLYVILILIWAFTSLSIGLLTGNDTGVAINDFKVQLYIVAFFGLCIISDSPAFSEKTLSKVLIICSLIIAFVSLIVFIFVKTGIMNFTQMSTLLKTFGNDVRVRRNGSFVYPGHRFVMITAVYLLNRMLMKGINIGDLILTIIFVISLIFSLTRGMILATCISFIFVFVNAVKFRKIRMRYAIAICMMLFALMYSTKFIELDRLSDYDDFSVGVRTTFIDEAFEKLDSRPVTYIFGNGFGTSLPSKGTDDLEVSVINILLEQGLIGIILWFSLYFCVINEIRKISKLTANTDLKIFCSGAIFCILAIIIHAQTNTGMCQSGGLMPTFILLLVAIHEFELIEKYGL